MYHANWMMALNHQFRVNFEVLDSRVGEGQIELAIVEICENELVPNCGRWESMYGPDTRLLDEVECVLELLDRASKAGI